MLERGQSQPGEGSRRCLCRSLDEPFADAPARSIPPRMLAGSRGRGAAAGGVEGSQPGGCPPARNRFARRREKPEACAEFPEGRDGPIHKLGAREVGDPFARCLRCGGSCFPVGLGQGTMLHMHGDQRPQPNLAQKSLGIKDKGRVITNFNSLRNQ